MRTAFFMPFPGTFLTGCRGCHRFFKLSIYRCGITLKTCSTPRVYILYKNACQPRQPVKIRLFLRKHSIFRHDNFIGCFSADKIKMSARK